VQGNNGGVFKRCRCRDPHSGQLIGATCPELMVRQFATRFTAAMDALFARLIQPEVFINISFTQRNGGHYNNMGRWGTSITGRSR
jgi:hypothetical protein